MKLKDNRLNVNICPVFGECGGCQYQDISYEQELETKSQLLREKLGSELGLDDSIFEKTLRSPQEYHYRNRLDLAFRRLKTGEHILGFNGIRDGKRMIIKIDQCPIARKEISDFIPELKEQAIAKLPEKKRNASLVVRSGDAKKVFWGGIGKRSLRMAEEDYFVTVIRDKKIYYSLDTFFQANLFILPSVMDKLEEYVSFTKEKFFVDLYSGVGLFGLVFAEKVKKVFMIEENTWSIKVAHHNQQQNQFSNIEIHEGRVEDKLAEILNQTQETPTIGFVDPPRAGLSASARASIIEQKHFERMLYLSCHPDSLSRDLKDFVAAGWRIIKIIPLDFFPRTKHVETLVVMEFDSK